VRPDFIILRRGIVGLSLRQTFPKSDVEKLGYTSEYSGYRNHQDSGLGLMVRTHVMPIMFARTLTEPEAIQLFKEIEASGLWLSTVCIPIGKPLF
jgi:hypothetical protein